MRKMKLFVLLLAVTLMLASAFAISSSAEEAVLKIDSANVAYNDMMHLVFTLKNTELGPDGAEAGIIVWDKAQEEYTVDNATFATFIFQDYHLFDNLTVEENIFLGHDLS